MIRTLPCSFFEQRVHCLLELPALLALGTIYFRLIPGSSDWSNFAVIVHEKLLTFFKVCT
jgi:hypothetical protein